MISKVVIFNVHGQIVKTQLIDNLINTINVEALKSGVYCVEVRNANGKTVKKFVVK